MNILNKIKDCFFSCIFISMTSLLKHWWHFSQWFKWGAYHTCHLQFLQLLPVLKAFPVLVWPSGQLAMGDRNGWTWSRLALPARTWWQPHDVAPRAVGSTIPTMPLGRSTGVLWSSPVVALGCPGPCTSWSQVSLLASAQWPSCLGVVRQEGFASLPLGGRPDPGWSSWTGISNPGGPVCTSEVPETWSRLALPARTWWQPHDVAPRAVGSTIPTMPLGRSTGVLWSSPVVALGCPGPCTSWSQVSLLASARWPSCLGVVRQEGFASLPLGGRPDPGWSSWTGISNPGGPVCTAEVPETWSRLALPARTWWQPHDVAPRAVGSTIPTTPLGRSTGVLWLSPVVALGCPGTCTSWSQVSLLASARWPSCLGVVRQEGVASLPLGGRPDPGWSSWTGISNLGGPVCTAEVPEKS